MPPLESIEETLGRLMPRAISEEGQRSMDAMLDELCGEEAETPPAQKRRYWRYAIPSGIAAALGFALIFQEEIPVESAPVAFVERDAGMVLLEESGRIEAISDEGWLGNSQGDAMQAVRLRVVNESKFRDEETGIVVNVTEPRDELVLSDVTGF